MSRLSGCLLVSATLLLTACGGSAPRRSKPKPAPEPSATAPSPAPAPAPSSGAQGQALGGMAKELTQGEQAKTVLPAKPATPAAPVGQGSAEFPEDNIAGKAIKDWFLQLKSTNVEAIKEACYALTNAGSKAKSAAPVLETLTKHQDPEVAKAATEALAAVNKK